MNSFINMLVLFKFIQVFSTYEGIISENHIIITDMCFSDCFFKFLFCFHRALVGLLNSFATCNNSQKVFLSISFSCNDRLCYKKIIFSNFFVLNIQNACSCLSYTSKKPSSSEPLSMLHCWLPSLVYLNSSRYLLRWWDFIESTFTTAVLLQYITWNVLTMDMCLSTFFPSFKLTMLIFIFSFYRLYCDSTSFQMFQ